MWPAFLPSSGGWLKAKVTVVNVTFADTEGLNGPMTLVVASASVKAGKVEFVAKNVGTIVHEMIVLKTTTAFDQLPVGDAGDPPAPVTRRGQQGQ